ncbi:hypothetical protein [Frateuria defendens]|uniref:hypothetical protein n=1 Tax=Frateuria defendens TaxID=2219559 RepID=UPI001F20E8DA|nr:hypothetical protein [Frateuria defendens]
MTVVCLAMLGVALCAAAPARQAPQQDFLSGIQPLRDDLPRYRYLVTRLPDLAGQDLLLAHQWLAFTENELGLYSEAVRDFPLKNQPLAGAQLPVPPEWEAVDAVEAIAAQAAGRRIVMVNEAHHDAHTRLLTLALLPRLRRLGFTHFAAEALDERDEGLMRRGYPVAASGSEYLHEPVYGEIVREAVRLGYTVVPYEAGGGSPQSREDGQARNLYRRALAGDPKARLFVHGGYAHIDKAAGRLGATVKPMGLLLRELSGSDPLCIDQVDLREEEPASEAAARREIEASLRKSRMLDMLTLGTERHRPAKDYYAQLISAYHPNRPVVFRRRDGQAFWSARPQAYDANVVLPPANEAISDYSRGPVRVELDGKGYPMLPPASRGRRPPWLALGGLRVPVPVDSHACKAGVPCLVEARYANESAEAVAADRYLFLEAGADNTLYLRSGAYRLRTVDIDGRVLAERALDVAPGVH